MHDTWHVFVHVQSIDYFRNGQILPTLGDNKLTVRVERDNNTNRYIIQSPGSAATINQSAHYACKVRISETWHGHCRHVLTS